VAPSLLEMNQEEMFNNDFLVYTLVATAVGILGGVVGSFWVPNVKARSAIQHFAAGLVIAAVASDVIPETERLGRPLPVICGFATGGLVMIGLKWLVVRFERRERARGKLPIGLAAAAALDTLIDGATISAGFAVGRHLGILLVVVLAVELFFLNLSVGTEFHKGKQKRWRGMALTSGIGSLLLVGSLAGNIFLADASEQAIAVFLAFGAAALIYLIAEELLVEAIEAEESLFSTAMLFAGFLCVFAATLISRDN